MCFLLTLAVEAEPEALADVRRPPMTRGRGKGEAEKKKAVYPVVCIRTSCNIRSLEAMDYQE